MKKLMTRLGLILLGMFTVMVFIRKDYRQLLKIRLGNIGQMIPRVNKNKRYPFMEYIGIPDQMEHKDQAQVENAKMVSEGSIYGVNYYHQHEDNALFQNHK